MATRLYSTAPGDNLQGTAYVIEAVGSATTSRSIEVTVDLGNVKQGNTKPLTQQDIVDGLKRIIEYIEQNKFPPA